ncbi:ATP-dependent DNA helicase RRM3-like protein [Tanacetum coccineum]
MGKNIQDFCIVPQDFSSNDLEAQTREIRAEKDIIVSQEDLDAIFKLNGRQKSAFETIIKKCIQVEVDEAPMAKRSVVKALNDLLQDLMSSTELFGDEGDACCVSSSMGNQEVDQAVGHATVSKHTSPTWNEDFESDDEVDEKLRLEENMRALLDTTFTESLLKIGNETETSHKNDLLNIPPSMLIQTHAYKDPLDALIDCEETEYDSFDETLDPNDQTQYEDFLHLLTPNGMPPHILVLKPNSPIILLRNLNPTEGLCNRIRLICKDLKRNVIHAKIAFGDFSGK